jgi:chloramphenicol 3-O-phosphotransferase
MDVKARLIGLIAEALKHCSRVLVAVDGPDTAGKTTFADDLARLMPERCVRAGIDGFGQRVADSRA